MTRDEIIAILEQHIKSLEYQQADPNEEDWQLIQDAKEGTTGQRVKAGNESAIQEINDLLEMG
jgi:hypothetical protein